MAEDTILNLMLNHHALLEALFISFADEVKDKTPRAESTLSELRWEMEKHFFTEESAIFDSPPLKIMGVWKIIKQLEKEHTIMLGDLRYFSDKLPDIKDDKINDFHNLLESHRKIEETSLYPKLDKEMQEDQKMKIILRINEIPINK